MNIWRLMIRGVGDKKWRKGVKEKRCTYEEVRFSVRNEEWDLIDTFVKTL